MDKKFYVKTIAEIIANVTENSVKYGVIKEYVDIWAEAKKDWIKRLGGTIYTYKTPITHELSAAERIKLVQDLFLSQIIFDHKQYPDSAFTYDAKLFVEFVELQKEHATYNLVEIPYTLPGKKIIPKGMKLLRAFKFFIHDKDVLSRAQDAMNMVISKCKFTGYLHISVDPLDYLTISENNYNWRSCHALDGDYGAGNLEYMMDKCTVVCYIDDKSMTQLRYFPEGTLWNNKQWRMLLFCSENGENIFAGRQYPTDIMTDDLWSLLKSIISGFFPGVSYWLTDWNDSYVQRGALVSNDFNTDTCLIRQRHIFSELDQNVYPLSSLYGESGGTYKHLFYDDIAGSTVYKYPKYLFGLPADKYGVCRTKDAVVVGVDSVTCPHCGEDIISASTDSFWCENCYDKLEYNGDLYTCDCCGRHYFHGDEGGYLIDDSWWCDACIADNAVRCAHCDGLCNIDDAYYDENEDIYLCENCYEEERQWQ